MYQKRKVVKGVPISFGIVMGRTRVILPGDIKVAEVAIATSSLDNEIQRLDKAVAKTIEELRLIRDSADKKIGGPVAKIFDAQLLIAGDYEFLKQVKEQIIAEKRNAGFIYNSLVKKTTNPLKKSDDAYMRQTVQDIEAVANKVLSNLGGYHKKPEVKFPADTILVGKSFTPGEILSYRRRKVTGFLIGEGGRNSHMALIARSLLIPVVTSEKIWTRVPNNCRIIIDGTNGIAIINPTDKDWTEYQRRRRRQGPATISRIKKLTQIPPQTADGEEINVAANLELPGPVDDILSWKNIPVGLYRTEFLYLEGDDFPDEKSQYEYYRGIAERFARSEVVLRTFDLGSDKFRDNDDTIKEDNPALGWRGIRSMLDMSEVFKTQIRAILRASVNRNLKILLPMISDVTELEKAKKLIHQAMLDLRRRNVPFDSQIKIGIMIEVPSAALTAEQLVQKVDFISIGTNDLTQYTMSTDRNNFRVANLYNSYHPSVLQLIKMTVEASMKYNKPVSVCGEMAGDKLALPLFIGMGVKSLSMNPTKITDICRLIKKIDSNLVYHLAVSVLSSQTAVSVTRKLQSFMTALEKK
ncbi:MAG: phosphoenolpyruvate--protein phosphotransferase [candidate division Zixibacteria bacterium]|nr:phosphoenolpyruvate--protein phosphotransferase [candidate division Zixibacteria bacterium]